MIDLTQLVLIVVVSSLTIVLLLVGIQVYKILVEVRQSVVKMNKILDDTGQISESVAKPISAVSGFFLGFKGGTILKSVLKVLKKHKDSLMEEN